jgi:hypothetical protein
MPGASPPMWRIVILPRRLFDTATSGVVWHSVREAAEMWADFYFNKGTRVGIQSGFNGPVVEWRGYPSGFVPKRRALDGAGGN